MYILNMAERLPNAWYLYSTLILGYTLHKWAQISFLLVVHRRKRQFLFYITIKRRDAKGEMRNTQLPPCPKRTTHDVALSDKSFRQGFDLYLLIHFN
jgi:hypothetical protein